jgi:Kef-type K+ transport system membrane component KefB
MQEHETLLLFLQILAMLLTALIFGRLARMLHQPAVFGELIGGVLLGPTVFGAIAPDTYASLFSPPEKLSIVREAVVNLGMLFFLFVGGLEVNLDYLRREKVSVALTSGLGVLLPFGLGFASVVLMPTFWSNYSMEQPMTFALFLATALSISALPIIARILIDLKLIQKRLGQVVLASATINDLVGWSLFAVILSTITRTDQNLWTILGLVFAFVILILSAGRWAGQRIVLWLEKHVSEQRDTIGVMATMVLFVAVVAESIGLHAIFGAFLVGVALARNSGQQPQAHETIHQFALGFFAPIFFVSIGLQTNFAANFDLPLVLLILTVASIGKIGGAGLGARIAGLPLKEALAVGFGMNARGAIEMILASVALEVKLIDERVFVALIVMAIVTTVLSGPIMQHLIGRRGHSVEMKYASGVGKT